MKYYKLNYNSLNTKETGTQFQSTEGIIGDIQSDFIPFEGKINFAFKLPEPFLEKKAKQTTYLNVIMIPSWFNVFKDYFIDFLNGFKIGEYQTWRLKVHQNGKIINDYCLFFLNNTKQNELVKFDESEFYLGKYSDYMYVGEDIKILNYENYLDILDVMKNDNDNFIKCRSIVLNLKKVKEDFFRIINVPSCSGFYVSERLKNAIEEQRFTGFAFNEIEEIDKKIKVLY
ncbi:hypothetical protein M0M57_04360 [Flavobacterium azooxidireducens]|uniref:Immunity protein 43 domain-containing protein n=1 Tax=Flavobacterium azooxidireducens TaxID=1871076 RepID=A0ABY4KI72_9FLAO|nr:hypothetical protein [Flavobacterium azooxidireducens]UPQ80070.1 hypothetical protein M0M57_04360 [Flavobacterium azooxidireducens]